MARNLDRIVFSFGRTGFILTPSRSALLRTYNGAPIAGAHRIAVFVVMISYQKFESTSLVTFEHL